MRNLREIEYMKNLDERETFVNNFSKKEQKNEKR